MKEHLHYQVRIIAERNTGPASDSMVHKTLLFPFGLAGILELDIALWLVLRNTGGACRRIPAS